MKEVWKDIVGYEGIYQVSNLGRVKSLERAGIDKLGRKLSRPSCIKKFEVDRLGYCRVCLYKGNRPVTKKIHRLVAAAFIDNPESKEQVNHIDGNKENNCVNNLEWNTRLENMRHAFNTGLYVNRKIHGEHSAVSKIDDIKGITIITCQSVGMKGEHIANSLGVNRQTVSKIKCNRTWNHLPRI